MRMRAMWNPFDGMYSLFFTDKNGGKRAVARRLVFDTSEDHTLMQPTASIESKEGFQELFDDLWNMGLRPSARSDEYKAQLATMNNHLNDMRTLVFKKRDDLTFSG